MWFGTLRAPGLDALFFDHHSHEVVAHVEAANGDAHGERCILGTIATPVTPAEPPVACGRFEAVLVASSERAPAAQIAIQIATSSLGPRAPPTHA